jgi:hypothetical protein
MPHGLRRGLHSLAASRLADSGFVHRKRVQMHTFWCNISLKKNSHFCLKYRKQRTGIFLAFQIYGSKGT